MLAGYRRSFFVFSSRYFGKADFDRLRVAVGCYDHGLLRNPFTSADTWECLLSSRISFISRERKLEENKFFGNLNGVADDINRIQCQRPLTVFAHLLFCTGAQRGRIRKFSSAICNSVNCL